MSGKQLVANHARQAGKFSAGLVVVAVLGSLAGTLTGSLVVLSVAAVAAVVAAFVRITLSHLFPGDIPTKHSHPRLF